jgi:hypothetical protein
VSKGNRRRKRKPNKQRKLPTVVPPSLKKAESPPAIEVAKLRPDKTVYCSKEILIVAPIEHCFNVIASQLEQPCQWDSILFNAQPVSDIRRQTGVMSQVILNLGGRKVDSQALISHYWPNRSISWVTTGKPKVKEAWHLEMKPGSTLVKVSLVLELNGWILERLIYKATRWKRVEEDMGKMLEQLKETAESAGRD